MFITPLKQRSSEISLKSVVTKSYVLNFIIFLYLKVLRKCIVAGIFESSDILPINVPYTLVNIEKLQRWRSADFSVVSRYSGTRLSRSWAHPDRWNQPGTGSWTRRLQSNLPQHWGVRRQQLDCDWSAVSSVNSQHTT